MCNSVAFIRGRPATTSVEFQTFHPLPHQAVTPLSPPLLAPTTLPSIPMALPFWIFHIKRIIQSVTSRVWLISLCLMFLRFIHAAARIRASLLWLISTPYTDRPRFVYPSSVDGHLGSFHLLTTVNNAALNMCVQALFEQLFSSLNGYGVSYWDDEMFWN